MQGEGWRLLTGTFLHGNFQHLLGNMMGLYAVGLACERIFGVWRMLGIYFFSACCGSILSSLLNPNFSVGASGAIFGVIGGGLVFYSIFHFAEDHSIGAILIFCIFAALGLASVIKYALWRIQKSSQRNTFFLSSTQEGFYATDVENSLIGQEGVVLTDLGPSGYIQIQGVRQSAIVKGAYLEKGVRVVVIDAQASYLTVKAVK